ncbi:ShlB/FhaC/HecB family hemolysin secretion/activation protein [Novosphingobium percolationis]|uniref:ShlB/FhaC/HecB family hemolysin secretion/activation protein n=1 Tax=Novosphingobium percolationis TaxID=2871811 RepID=UPI001CD4B5B0|nr:ShlB/FhaC/HecB family hemolysin secretion/activation protein [Novosphingobium percolationis]
MIINAQPWSRRAAVVAPALAVALTAAPACAQEAAAPVAAQDAAPANAEPEASGKFTVDSIEVVGATALSADEIEGIVYRYTGEGRTAADIEAARKALQDAYAAKGYEAAVVDIPAQDEAYARAGIVQIRVSEAPVGEVRIAGAKHHSTDALRGQLPAIQPGKPLNLRALQTELVQANRIPDRQVQPSFRPSKTEGAIDVELKVKDQLPFHGSVELGNDNSPNTHPLRLAASARYTNLWGAGHTVSASYIVTPQDRKQTEVISGSYNAPILGSPWSLVLFGYKSNSNIAALGGTQVLGNGWQVGARAIYRLSGERVDQSFSIGLDYKDFKQDIVIASKVANKAPIRYIPAVLGYSWSYAGDKSQFDVNLNATFGLRVVKRLECTDLAGSTCTSVEDQFTIKDYNARENFTHVNADISATRLIADDVSLIVKLAGQYADSHLVSNEQFGIGGESTVRGYFQSQAVGDRGIAATLQVDGPSLATYLPDFVGELRPFVFFDSGIASLIDPLVNQESTFRLASIGGGIRYRLFKHLSGGVTVGVPLLTNTTTRAGDTATGSSFGAPVTGRAGHPRITFSARGEF